MSEAKKLLRSTSLVFGSQIIANVLSYILIIILARTLGDIGLGQYAFIFATISAATIFLDFGVGAYFIIKVAKHPSLMKKYFPNQMAIRLCTATLSLAIVIITSFFIDKQTEVIYSLWIGALAIFFMNVGNGIRYAFNATERFDYNATALIIERVVAFILGIYVLLVYKSLILFVSTLAISYFSTVVGSLWLLRNITPFKLSFDLNIWRKLFSRGFIFFLRDASSILINKTDTLLLSLMIGDAVTGWYNAAYKFVEVIHIVPFAATMVLMPTISRLHKKNRKKLKLLMEKATKYLILIALPVAIGTTVIAERLIHFIYGSQFNNASIALQLLIWMEAFIFINQILGQGLDSVLKQKYYLLAVAAGAFVNLAGNILLIPKWSLIGAGVATILAQVVIFLIVRYYVNREIVSLSFVTYLWKPATGCLIMFIVLDTLQFLPLWWLIGLAVTAYSLSLLLLKAVEPEEISLIKEIVKKRLR